MNKISKANLITNIIAKLNLHQIVIFSKPPNIINIIATNISHFTVRQQSDKVFFSYLENDELFADPTVVTTKP